MGKIVQRVAVMFATFATACVLTVGVSAQPASAWTGGKVWINFSSAMCSGGGSVVGVYWAVDGYSSGPANGDFGDNVIYPSVRIGASNTLSFQLVCKKWGWYTYRAGAGQRVVSPYKGGLSYTYFSYY